MKKGKIKHKAHLANKTSKISKSGKANANLVKDGYSITIFSFINLKSPKILFYASMFVQDDE